MAMLWELRIILTGLSPWIRESIHSLHQLWCIGLEMTRPRDSVKSAVCHVDDIDELIMLGMGYARIEDDGKSMSISRGRSILPGMMQRSSPFWQVRSSKRDFRAMPCMPPEKPFNRAEPAEASLTLGSACVMLDRDADAVEPLRRATRLMPDNAVPPFLLGVALYETNQFAEAVRAFGEAAKREPEDRMIDIWRAKALYDNGQTDDAIRMVDSFMEEAVDSADLAVEMANFYGLNAKMPEKAVPLLEKAIELDPTIPEAYFNLTYASLLVGDENGARRALQRLYKVDGELAELAIENLPSMADCLY